MMQTLAQQPAFWLALGAVFGVIKVWADAKRAEILARGAKGTQDAMINGQGVQQLTLQQHTAAIAALQAVTPAPNTISSSSPSVPAGGGQPGTLAPVPVAQGGAHTQIVAADAPAIVLPSSDIGG